MTIRGTSARLAALFLSFALLLGVTGCVDPPESAAAEPIPVSLAVSREVMSGYAYLARNEGLFEKHGLDVAFMEYSSSQLALEALLAGEANAAICADTPIVLAALRGRATRIFATISTHENDIQIVARRSAGITDPQDLRGKRIGTRSGTAADFFLHSFLTSLGLGGDDVIIEYGPFDDVTAALIAGDLDAISIREPQITQAREALGDDALVFESEGLYKKSMNLVCDQEGVCLSDEAKRRLVSAMLEAEELFTGDDAETYASAVAADLGVSVEAICDCMFKHGSVKLEQALVISLEDQARWARASGMSTTTIASDFLELIDTTAIGAVAPDRVSVVR